jgi:quercetin 2,3-dioxygenase
VASTTQTSAQQALSSWLAQSATVGHFEVRRALPTPTVQAVGPFVFFDHFGPAPARQETLPAHPHAGIEVMTYLLSGGNEHRDSKGHQGTVQAGGAQWMRAGSGILHAETVLPELGDTVQGLQLWSRLPVALQESEPAYRAIAAEEVPQWQDQGCTLRLLAGQLQARTGPIELALAAFMLHLQLPPGTECALDLGLALPGPPLEWGAYVIQAESDRLLLDGTRQERGRFTLLDEGKLQFLYAANARSNADVFVLGGQAAPRPLHFGGPFVLDSRAALTQAQKRFASGQMGTLDGVPF